MGGTDAERQRRHRAHKRGDHSLCDPDRCSPEAVTVTVTPVTADPTGTAPTGLAERGRRLWMDVTAAGKPGPLERVLLEEACRLADRLDRLDALLTGDAADWIDLVETKGDPDRQEVVIDKALAEARQGAVALKQIVTELRQVAGGAAPASGQGQEGSFRDQLAARRAARLADAAGS